MRDDYQGDEIATGPEECHVASMTTADIRTELGARVVERDRAQAQDVSDEPIYLVSPMQRALSAGAAGVDPCIVEPPADSREARARLAEELARGA